MRKTSKPSPRREAVVQVQQQLQMPESRACRVLKHCRDTYQYVAHHPDKENRLRKRIIELARAYGRYGYQRITALLHLESRGITFFHAQDTYKKAR